MYKSLGEIDEVTQRLCSKSARVLGFATCWESATGKELWKERLGGAFFASPVLVGERIYATNLAGKTFVYSTDPKEFKLLATNQLGNEVYASPIVSGNRLYLRVAFKGAKRQEHLYCIGKSAAAAAAGE
jgi:outer membrane protein assembly factor BamB